MDGGRLPPDVAKGSLLGLDACIRLVLGMGLLIDGCGEWSDEVMEMAPPNFIPSFLISIDG